MKTLHRRRPLGQRLVTTVGALALFPLLYPLARVMVRDDRKAGAR